MSDITKHNRRWYRFFAVLSFLFFVGPAAYYFTSAFITSTAVAHKATLMASLVIVLILTAVCAVNKMVLRSRIWILIIALYFVLDSIVEPIMVIGITQILDEIIIHPSKEYFKKRYIIHKEVDKR